MDVADALMLAGADANNLDAENEGLLHLASMGGHTGVAKNLLQHGADPDVKISTGQFPIHLTARHGQDEVVHNVLRAGVQVTCLSDGGWTADSSEGSLGEWRRCEHSLQ